MKRFSLFALGFVATLLFLCVMLIAPPLAFAQFQPPPNPGSQSTVGFWAAGKTSALSATTSTSRIALSTTSVAYVQQIQVYNSAASACFVAFGDATVTASVGSGGTSTSDYPVAPGAVVVITIPLGAAYAAGVCGGSGTVYFTPGLGL